MIISLINELFSAIDELIYLISNFFDPIPPHGKKEFLEEYVKRIEKRHALRYLKHRISKHLDLSPETEEVTVNRYRRKRDRKLTRSLISMLREVQDEEIRVYNQLRFE